MTNQSKYFLEETIFCDYRHPAIQSVANNYKSQFQDKEALAIELFYFVRDHVYYQVGNWKKKASQTLLTRKGTCTNKANLLVALCRALNIPAGYGVMEVFSPQYFGPIALHTLSRHASRKSKHIYSCIYLKDKWIKCDVSDDKEFSLNTQHLNPPSRIVEWDGKIHATLNIHPDHVIRDTLPLENIDHLIAKRQRPILMIPLLIGNLYITFLRKNGSRLSTIDGIEREFIKWLSSSHRLSHLIHWFFQRFYIL